ncbi:MAG: hypothetical protein A7316_10785 [Candidatus Altiarchaeales archaeon WOR_SM1_86-2]|nr:MAG: hypothetical protein A7316_10785 [Candidatus Altiarchaeales archaeon WOR_SM1_86-2]
MIDIKEILTKSEMLGLVIPDREYDKMLIKVASILSEGYDKVLYISIDKPYKSLVSDLKQISDGKINMDKFHFIDCITRTERDAQSTKNCTYISSPLALDEIHRTILNILKKRRIDVTLVDSPSSLSTYYEHMDVLKFMHLLMTKLIIAKCKGVFPFHRESAGPARRSIEMFVDKIVYLE